MPRPVARCAGAGAQVRGPGLQNPGTGIQPGSPQRPAPEAEGMTDGFGTSFRKRFLNMNTVVEGFLSQALFESRSVTEHRATGF